MPQPGNSTTAWRWRWCRECPGDSAEEGLGSVTVTSPSAQPPSCPEHSVGLHWRETTNAPRFMFLTGAPVLSWWRAQSWQRVGLRCMVPGSAALSTTQALLGSSGAGHGRGWGHNSHRRSQRGPAHGGCLAMALSSRLQSTGRFPREQQVILPTAANYHECLTGERKLQVLILLHIKLLLL